jgi:magnesium transporter
MLKVYGINEGRFCEANGQHCNVLVFTDPTEEERKHLVNELKIDEHTLSSSLDPDELSRLEFEPDHAAMIVKRPKSYSAEDQFVFKISSLGLFLFADKLVMVGSDDLLPFEGRHFQKIGSLPDLLLRLLYRITLHYIEHLKIINSIGDSLEDKIVTAMENRYLINLFSLEKGLTYYHNAIHSNGVLIDKLKASAARLVFTPENMEFLDDLIIENNQCMKQAEIFSNIFASLMDARVSVVNNNLNVLMKTLNIITIAIMVPTFVVSVFSMNVLIPVAHLPYSFWLVLGISAASSAAFFMVFRLINRRSMGRIARPRRVRKQRYKAVEKEP